MGDGIWDLVNALESHKILWAGTHLSYYTTMQRLRAVPLWVVGSGASWYPVMCKRLLGLGPGSWAGPRRTDCWD